MSTINNDTTTNEDVRELTSKIQQFLSQQIESNGELSEAAKESLTVATECIEQAYNIQRKPASKDLLNMYRGQSRSAPQQQQQQNQQGQPQQANQQVPDPTQLITNLASTLFSQVGGNFVNAAATAAANLASGQTQPPTSQATPSAPSSEQATSSTASSGTQADAPPRTTRKKATEAEVLAAESHKNQGNDCMKADKYKEAYDYYTQAIEIDNNNAIYYSNRAAASSKLGNHQAALRDCQEAIEIDPTYSKAYSRMGLSYASMDNHQKAKEAYVKAVELDPLNETYKNNLAAAEEKLAEAQNAGGAGGANAQAGGGPNVANMLRSMMSNPDVMNMAMRSLQDPRIQSMFGLGGGGGGAAPGGGGAGAPH